MKNIKIEQDNIVNARTESIIIPLDSYGLIDAQVNKKIIDRSGHIVKKNMKQYIENNNINIPDCFLIDAGQLKRINIKYICYCVIKRFNKDFTNINIVKKGINKCFKHIMLNNIKSVAIGAIGTELNDIELTSSGRLVFDNCIKYNRYLDIKIIDENKEFIDYIKERVKKYKD
ncbi:MAG: macro domain-containing protein [Candidatus Woesearchaeota archaeon]